MRGERELVRLLQDHGLAAEKQPLSGSLGGRFSGDVSVPLLGVDRVAEVKVRASDFSRLYAWLNERDLLALKSDRCDWLIVAPLKVFLEIAVAAEQAKGRKP